LSAEFHAHLRNHAVPLSKNGIALLAGNSFGLDMYALFAHRLHRLQAPLRMSWAQLQNQIGSEYGNTKNLARRVRDVLPEVITAYPEAKVELGRHGLLLKPSQAPVAKKMVQVINAAQTP